MEHLADEEVNEVLVETGSVLAGAFLQEGLVDEIVVYMAAKLLGATARPLFDFSLETMDQAINLNVQSVSQVGQDVKLVFTPHYEQEE